MSSTYSMIRLACLLTAFITMIACDKQEVTTYKPTFSTQPAHTVQVYIIGVHPLHNPKRLMEVYQPILEHINQKMPGVHFRLEPARNYDEFEKKLYAGYYNLAMPNPYQTIRASRHGYHVFAKMSNDADFHGIILVRKDSGIHEITDLKGREIAYPAQTALAAGMLPQFYLHTHGLDIN